jgi:excisionase family DNA binding protein
MPSHLVRDLDELPAILAVEEVAAVLRVSRALAYQLVRQPGFPLVEVGRRMLVPKAALVQWVEQRSGYPLANRVV